MKKKWKYLLGAGALVLGAYAFWPSSEEKTIDDKVGVKEEKVISKPKFDFEKAKAVWYEMKRLEEKKEEVVEEESNLPPCLRCDDWKPKVKRKYYITGKIYTENVYVCEVLHGTNKSWYPDGQMKSYGEYFCGKPHGRSIEWYVNGEVRSEGTHLHEKEHGQQKKWSTDGKPTFSVKYDKGKRHGSWKVYNISGNLVFEKQYRNGKLIKVSEFDTSGEYTYPVDDQDLKEEELK